MLNWGALLTGFFSMFLGIYYCMTGNVDVAIFHGLIFVGMTNIFFINNLYEKKKYDDEEGKQEWII
jgi:hypothetical protein